MPDTPVISKVKLNNTEYDIKDADARSRLTTAETKLSGIAEGATVDDHKWNGINLTGNTTLSSANQYIPQLTTKSATSGSAGLLELTETPTAYRAVKYDSNAYLKSTTPAAGDKSTKVATTAFVDNAISSLGSVLNYKGTKATVAALPSSDNTTGDVWHVTADGSEWAWDGSDWQELGTTIDLSGYVPTSRTVNGKALTSDISLTASDVSALPSSTTYVSSFNGESGSITYTAPVTSVNGQTGAVTISDSDEKLKTESVEKNGFQQFLIVGSNSTSAETKKYSESLVYYRSSTNQSLLQIGLSGNQAEKGVIRLYSGGANANSYTTIFADTATGARTITFPNATGTLALTSDIPQHYNATTNPTGYLTISDLPIYDGTVVQGGS